jgi:hypothetical protein
MKEMEKGSAKGEAPRRGQDEPQRPYGLDPSLHSFISRSIDRLIVYTDKHHAYNIPGVWERKEQQRSPWWVVFFGFWGLQLCLCLDRRRCCWIIHSRICKTCEILTP